MGSDEVGHEGEQDGPLITRRWVRWLVVFGCYTLIGLFFCGQNILRYVTRGDPVLWQNAITVELLYWYLLALLTPSILWYARRFRLERPHRWRSLLAHLMLAALVAPVLELGWRFLVATWIRGMDASAFFSAWPEWRGSLLVGSLTAFYKYWILIAIYYTFDYYRKYRHREREALDLTLKASRLEAQLTRAQLLALKMQLHPHFLFNTLNAISVLIRDGQLQGANRMLLRLSDLLRVTLESAGAQEVSLKQELDFLQHYLDIEKIRFQDRLTVAMEIDPHTLDALVPNLILQPLVENAVRHGIASRLAPGRIVIQSARTNGSLRLEVRDDGPGLAEAEAHDLHEGIGLSTTRARLAQHYGTTHRFELDEAAEGGLRVTLVFPFRTEEDNASLEPE